MTDLQVERFERPEQFAAAAAALFDRDPFSTSVVATVAAECDAGRRPCGPHDAWWTVSITGQVAGVAMHTPPYNLFVSRMPADGAKALAALIATEDRSLPGVTGELAAVGAFAEAWRAQRGGSSVVQVAERMYRLAELAVPGAVTGAARPATTEDLDLLARWFAAFHDEATPHAPHADWRLAARRRVDAGQLVLWSDGDPVALGGHSEAVAGVARIGPVYTPPERRGRGYGSAVAAAASAAALDGGAAQVVLYTDLANPVSNAIYQAIGYVPDHDAQQRAFTP